jgi:hypothetical protein
MRFVALFFGLLGAAGSGFLGNKWQHDIQEQRAKLDLVRALAEVDPKTKERLETIDRLGNTAYALLAGAALAVAGCVLVMLRQGYFAAGLFCVGFIAPIVVGQDPKVAIFSFGLALAGLVSVFVKPKREKPVKRRDHIPEDTDMVG